MEKVVLVTEQDEAIGTMEKMEAHKKGVLHRAFSVFIFNEKGEMLLQQRAMCKYHSPGLWTNACCSHPREGETVLEAGHRRLMEEMGFDCDLKQMFQFIYRADLDQEMIEHELDHVMIGTYDQPFTFNEDEVMATRYVTLDDLKKEMDNHPETFTVWFKIALPELLERMEQLA